MGQGTAWLLPVSIDTTWKVVELYVDCTLPRSVARPQEPFDAIWEHSAEAFLVSRLEHYFVLLVKSISTTMQPQWKVKVLATHCNQAHQKGQQLVSTCTRKRRQV